MTKRYRSSVQNQSPAANVLRLELPMPVVGAFIDARAAFHELCIETGREVLSALMESDREALCGVKGRHQPGRATWRAGSVPSRVTLGGRQIELPRLRVRGESGELGLQSFHWAASRDALDAHTLEAIAAGVSTRKYRRTLDPLAGGRAEHAVSSSCVSRRFVALSSARMEAFLSRSLQGLALRAVFIDGKVFQAHCMLMALGVDAEGAKHVLGLREGSTENATVAAALIADLIERGLPTDRPLLFVIDGAKALRKAIRDAFGTLALVQRCQVHKQRNVLGHLPEALQASTARALREAWAQGDVDLAERQLERLAAGLERGHPGAAASLREGLEETLTVQSLGLTGALARTLKTTNPIENMNSALATYTRNVKRWRGGLMVQRWVCTALAEAEKHFRRVRGYRDLRQLSAALDARVSTMTNAKKAA
jgi:putative transposase